MIAATLHTCNEMSTSLGTLVEYALFLSDNRILLFGLSVIVNMHLFICSYTLNSCIYLSMYCIKLHHSSFTFLGEFILKTLD
jgi:hypothetical protein